MRAVELDYKRISRLTTLEPDNPGAAMSEDYEKMRRQLKQMLARKNKVEKELDTVEDKIYLEETTYLQDAVAGNISKGFENYTKSNQSRRRTALTDQDRIFSQSSTLLQDP